MLKRPSSARRHIKQETFSSFVSSTRLNRVQSLLHDGYGDGPQQADAILCVHGIDCRYHDGSREIINYLLFDFFASRKAEIERSGFSEEDIDDVMMVIKKHSVEVYCNPINYHYMLPYIAHWRGLHLYCLTEEHYVEGECAEEFKIESLIAMVEGCHNIGIPYTSTTEHADKKVFEKMIIEKWPIIQAFALEDYGSGGFFTLKHEVMDVSESLWKIYQQLDPVCIEHLVTQTLPLFEGQWEAMLNVLNVDKGSRVGSLSESAVCDVLSSYFFHGRMGHGEQGSTWSPYVMFGCHSTQANISRGADAVSAEITVGKAGIGTMTASHMVCQAVSPRTALSCARTYFFGTGIPAQIVSRMMDDPEVTPESSAPMSDISMLIWLYMGCVKAVMLSIDVYSTTLSIRQAEDQASDFLRKWCDQHIPQVTQHISDRKHMQYELTAFNSNHQTIPIKDGSPVLYAKSARLVVYDVPSLQSPRKTLGSVVFAETFLDSTIFLKNPDGSTTHDSCYCILTRQVPRILTWPVENTDREERNKIDLSLSEAGLAVLGKKLAGPDTGVLLAEESPDAIIQNGNIWLYEGGVVYQHARYGCVVLPLSQLDSIHLYDGDSVSVVAVLLMVYKSSIESSIPQYLRSKHRCLTLALLPKSKAYKVFFSQALHQWRKSSEELGTPAVEQLEELPENIHDLHKEIQASYNLQASPVLNRMKQAKTHLPDLTLFLDHLAVSSMGKQAVPRQHLPALLNQPYDEGGFTSENKMTVTVLTGLPGGGKDRLCSALTKLAKEESRWVVLQRPGYSAEPFSAAQLQATLSDAWKAQTRSKRHTSHKKMRALVVTPGFTDIVDVVHAITSHPDPTVRCAITIGAASVCVNPENAYMSDHYTLPRLLDQCAQGWVNNIVFTGSVDASDNRLDALQQLIRSVNSDVSFILTHNTEISRSQDLDMILAEDAFSDGALLRARHLSCPGWLERTGSVHADSSMMEVELSFSQPLDRNRLIFRLKGLKAAHKKPPFTGNVYHVSGRVRFTGADELYDLQYTVLSGSMFLHVADMPPTPPTGNAPPQRCGIVVSGCGLQTEVLKDWLRQCAKQKPQPKEKKSRSSLTKAERDKVHKAHHLDELPEGWFYNGSQYVCMDGTKTSLHPNFEHHLSDYIDSLNKDIEHFNAEIAKTQYKDLFEE